MALSTKASRPRWDCIGTISWPIVAKAGASASGGRASTRPRAIEMTASANDQSGFETVDLEGQSRAASRYTSRAPSPFNVAAETNSADAEEFCAEEFAAGRFLR